VIYLYKKEEEMRIITREEVISFPSTGTVFTVNNSAVEKACAILGVNLPVKIKVTSGKVTRVGSWKFRNGIHGICISRMQSRLEVNKTLWHELQHAADYEKRVKWDQENPGRKLRFSRSKFEQSAIATENKYAGNSLLV
jgi:hypothetical protein